MPQLIAHLFGDYVLQSTWMAMRKNKVTWICLLHCLTYTVCFIPLTSSWRALGLIFVTHFLIDRFGLARYAIWLKEWQSPYPIMPFSWCSMTGYFDPEKAQEAIRQWGNQDRISHLTRWYSNLVEDPLVNRPIWIRVWLFIITDNLFHLMCNYAALTYFT